MMNVDEASEWGSPEADLHVQGLDRIRRLADEVRSFWGIEHDPGYGEAMRELSRELDRFEAETR